jgi:hypothetical protein
MSAKADTRFDRYATVACATFVALALVGIAADAIAAPRPAKSRPDGDWTDLPEQLAEDILPAPAVHRLASALPNLHGHRHHPHVTPSPMPNDGPKAAVRPSQAPTKATPKPTPTKTPRGRHRLPHRHRITRHTYAHGMAYHVIAQGLQGRTRFTDEGVPGVLKFLASHGLTAGHDEIRRTLAEGGEWRGLVGSGNAQLTVHITADNHG